MERRIEGPIDPVDLFLDYLEQHGSAAAMLEVSMPGHVLGFVFSQGRSKFNCVVTCSSCFIYTYLRQLVPASHRAGRPPPLGASFL